MQSTIFLIKIKNKPSLDLKEGLRYRRTTSVRQLARSFDTDRQTVTQTFCYLYLYDYNTETWKVDCTMTLGSSNQAQQQQQPPPSYTSSSNNTSSSAPHPPGYQTSGGQQPPPPPYPGKQIGLKKIMEMNI